MTSENAPVDADSIAPDRTDADAAPIGELRAMAAAVAPAGPHETNSQKLDHAVVRAVVFGIMLAMFLSALEQTIVAPALPAIGKSLGSVDELSWVVTAYLLAATATIPLFGKLSDIYGRRTILLAAISIFIAGSVACAMAPSIWLLILGRGLQGIGGGGLLPISQTIIADMLTPRERPVVQGRTSVVFMSASILGPVLGGLLTDHLHWSLIFWINVPLGLIALVTTERALRRLPRHDRPHQLDVLGALLMVGAALTLMLALAWGGTHYPWRSAPIIALIASSIALWVLFAIRLLSAREPFIPLAILHGRVTSTITCAAFFSVGTIVGITIFTPLYCQTVLGVSASVSGTALIAFMSGAVVGSQITARLMMRLTRYLRLAMFGQFLAVGALAIFAINPAGRSLGEVGVLLFVLGCGLGPMYPMSTILMQNAVKPHQMGTATGTLNFFRTLGGAIIVAVFGAILLGGATGGSGGMTLEKLALNHGDMAPAFHWVFITAAVFIGISFLCLLGVEETPLRGPALANEGAGE